jgi:hypothetical protein
VGSYFTAALGALLISAMVESAEPAPLPPQTPPASSQTAPVKADVEKLPISVDRIREQLDREPALSLDLLNALSIPVFRIETRNDLVFRPDPSFWKDDDVAPYARPQVNRWHYDFMKMVNPDLPTGYGPGGGVDVLPGIQAIFSGIKHANQERERVRVRQQIQEELRAINEARRQQGLPPLEESAVQPSTTTTTTATPTSAAKPTNANGTSASSPSPQPSIKVSGPPNDPR